jgi:transcriptional regulator with XRE-family HTH domain
MPRARNPIDRLVGARIRSRREEIGLSQAALGAEIGVTFQQIQKYESGCNRVGAGRLFEISVVLGISVEFFYRDAGFRRGKAHEIACCDPVLELFQSEDGRVLAKTFVKIADPSTRKAIVRLVAEISSPGADAKRDQEG